MKYLMACPDGQMRSGGFDVVLRRSTRPIELRWVSSAGDVLPRCI